MGLTEVLYEMPLGLWNTIKWRLMKTTTFSGYFLDTWLPDLPSNKVIFYHEHVRVHLYHWFHPRHIATNINKKCPDPSDLSVHCKLWTYHFIFLQLLTIYKWKERTNVPQKTNENSNMLRFCLNIPFEGKHKCFRNILLNIFRCLKILELLCSYTHEKKSLSLDFKSHGLSSSFAIWGNHHTSSIHVTRSVKCPLLRLDFFAPGPQLSRIKGTNGSSHKFTIVFRAAGIRLGMAQWHNMIQLLVLLPPSTPPSVLRA